MGLVLLTALVTSPVSEAFAQGCDYRFTGSLRVMHQIQYLQDQMGQSTSLEDVRVRVSARIPPFNWIPWETQRTDRNGSFDISVSKPCISREYRVRVMFRSPDLEIRNTNASVPGMRKVKWYTIGQGDLPNQDLVVAPGGSYTFGEGEPRDLGRREPRHHAEIWALYDGAIDHMRSAYGDEFAFENKVKVKYPHSGLFPDNSYANPINQVIYLLRNPDEDIDAGEEVGVMLHELMHIWAYQHSRGEEVLASYLVGHGTTHGVVQNRAVSFHEGFAEWGAQFLQRDFLGDTANRPRRPFTHNWLQNQTEATTQAQSMRSDDGWYNLLFLLADAEIWEWDFNSQQNLARPDASVSSVLEPYCTAPQVSFEEQLGLLEQGEIDLHTGGINSIGIYALPLDFSVEDYATYLTMVDPQASQNDIQNELCGIRTFLYPPVVRFHRLAN